MALTQYVKLWNLRGAFRRMMGDEPPRVDGALTPDAKRFLTAMRWFCYVDRSCVVITQEGQFDTHLTAIAEGRREVFIEIQRVMNVTDAELLALKDHNEETEP